MIDQSRRVLRGWGLTQSEAARLFGVSRQALSKWSAKGVPADRLESVANLAAATDLVFENGRIDTMQTTIDGAGRLVVPKKLRDRLALGGGGVVEVIERDGIIEIHPVPANVDIVDAPGGPVAQPIDFLPPLTDVEVRDTLERLRR